MPLLPRAALTVAVHTLFTLCVCVCVCVCVYVCRHLSVYFTVQLQITKQEVNTALPHEPFNQTND